MELLLEGAQTIDVHHRFPASVRHMESGHTWRKTAVVLRGGRLQVAERIGASQEVDVLIDKPAVEAQALMDRTVLVTTDDGAEYLIDKGDGCGCHSPLQRWYQQHFA